MGQLYIPVEKEINGPWFLGNEELEELYDIFEAINIELTKSFEIDIEEEANKRITKGYYKDLATAILELKERYKTINEKKVSLISSDDKKLSDISLKGILKDPKLNDFKPKELRLEIERGYNNHFSLVIEKRFNDKLEYKAKSSSENSLKK